MVNPSVGVWLSDDGTVGAPDPSNSYRYVGNDPVNAVDPSGLSEVGIPTIIYRKDLARMQWRLFAWAIEKKGYPLTADLLRDSLQDNPPCYEYGAQSALATAMISSTDFDTLIKKIGKAAPVGRIPAETEPRGIIFQGGDLFVGVHEAELHIKGGFKKDDNNFEITVAFADTYNFELHFKDGMRALWLEGDLFKAAGWSANNIAWWNEIGGMISPYQWYTEPITIVVKGGKIQ